MNGLDAVIVVVVLISILLAAAQGFFFEIFSLAGVVIGYVVAAWSYHVIAPWFLPYVKTEWIADGAAFLVIFLSIVILAGVIARLTKSMMQEIGLRWFDRMLGGVFGALRGGLIVMALLMAMASFSPNSPVLRNSQFAPYFLVLGRGAMWVTPSEFRAMFRAGLDSMRDRGNNGKDSPVVGQQPAPKSSIEHATSEKK